MHYYTNVECLLVYIYFGSLRVDLPGLLELCSLSVVGHPQVVYMGQHYLYRFTHPLLLDIQTHSHIHYLIPLKIYFHYTVSSSTSKITLQLLLQNALICHTGKSYRWSWLLQLSVHLFYKWFQGANMPATVIYYFYQDFFSITLCLYFSYLVIPITF